MYLRGTGIFKGGTGIFMGGTGIFKGGTDVFKGGTGIFKGALARGHSYLRGAVVFKRGHWAFVEFSKYIGN